MKVNELMHEALLDEARKEANAKFERMHHPAMRGAFEPERKAMVVRAYLERISPIVVPEAL